MNKKHLKRLIVYKNAGFTLIELLVVVLIIGILAAVAVPQYEKAVEKARAAEAFIVLKSIAEANRVYYLANGKYAVHLEDLDIKMPGADIVFQGDGRTKSKYFMYGTNAHQSPGLGSIALADRLPSEYYLFIMPNEDGIFCKGFNAKGDQTCRDFGASVRIP